MPNCGIEKLYVAQVLTDTAAGMTFDTPKYYQSIKQLDIKPKTNVEKGFAENRQIDQVSMFESADVAMNRYGMSSAERAYVFGQTVAAAGGVVASLGDKPPFVALLYKAPIKAADGTDAYRYGVIYKTQFVPHDDTMKGLEGKPDLSQTPNISGSAIPTNWSFTDGNGKEKHPWEYHVDTTDPNCPANIDTTWFNAVTIPSTDTTAPVLSSTVPAANATAIAVSSAFQWVFNEAIDSGSVVAGNFFLIKDTDGTAVAGSLTQSADGKTITFTPTANLSAATVYRAICTADVKDLANNALGTPKVNKFTTA